MSAHQPAAMTLERQARQHLIYLHIPKAGGSTLKATLGRFYRDGEVFQIVRPHRETTAAFINLPEEKRASIRLLAGHMPFGLHVHFPRPSAYITLVRDPVERVVSHYHFVRRSSRHLMHEKLKNLTLEEYVSSGVLTEMDNGQVRLLSGHDDDIPFGECTSDLLDQAKRNLLDHFLVAGLTERFDESLLLMRRRLGWTTLPFYRRENVAARRTRVDELAASTIALINRHNELDRALYQWAAERLQRALNEEGLQGQLALFRRMNAVYQPYGKLKLAIGRSRQRAARWVRGRSR
jgi:hypothetical protein